MVADPLPLVLRGLPNESPNCSERTLQELEALAGLETSIGYAFANRGLLRVALTLPSWVNELRRQGWPHNACLEFFGDAVLDLCAAHAIWLRFPELAEGPLTRLRSSVVSRSALSEAGTALDLGRWLFIGRGDERGGGRQRAGSIADAVEAVLGAAFLDARAVGRDPMAAAEQVFDRFLGERVAKLVSDDGVDAKSRLQQVVQGRWKLTPIYEETAGMGRDGAGGQVVVEVYVMSGEQRVVLGEGKGESRKLAQRAAARDALDTQRYEQLPR